MKLTLSNLKDFRNQIIKERDKVQTIMVCCGTGCRARGSEKVADAIKQELKESELDNKISVELTKIGCHGWCEQGPVVTVEPAGTFYTHVKPKDSAKIVNAFKDNKIVESLLYYDRDKKKRVQRYADLPFYSGQTRWAMRHVGRISPTDIDQYIAANGYSSLAKVLSEMNSDQIIETIKASHLRGRGGAGYETGKKWESCKNASGAEKYIICNGDEGDPGAFMDCAIMEADPHGIIEGMIIGAYAISASQGYIYVRQEYPVAIEHLRIAINQAREYGLLGDNIFGTDFCFDISIARGGGAFVCGESSALMRSIEGKPGEPRAKYIHATQKGLFDKPTVLNNVETFVNIPFIIEKGADFFSSIGTDTSKGTKAFSVVGKVKRNGLIEVPMGTTIKKIIELAGGVPNKRTLKAIQTGGPSGGCLPASMLDLPLDFEGLSKAGSMMGSGGFIVMDDRNCMVDIALYFINFLIDESCGKCVPCREGLKQLSEILTRITKGNGVPEDLDKIEDLAFVLSEGSLCALGKSAANPVLSALRYFRHEFEEHINQKYCRAGVCANLTRFEINDKCTGCTACVIACPANCIEGIKNKIHIIDQDQCIQCGSCFDVCRYDAVTIRGAL